jgi:sterol desaturase/sphingolipid hydroxylase (fatty acid hydroxylase superfamily)
VLVCLASERWQADLERPGVRPAVASEREILNEPTVRLSIFLGLLGLLAIAERLFPRRLQGQARRSRWPVNLGLSILNTLLLRLVFPVAAVGAAVWAAEADWGMFNVFATPPWLAAILSFLLLDLAIYGQHRLFHAVPWLWRVHRGHHIDLEVDVTTAGRFHPIEMLLSMLWKIVVVVALGAPAEAVLAFEIMLNAAAMFSHARIGMPTAVDGVLRWVLVTPDMHRIHHSIHRDETDSNYGFLLSTWDRLFDSYRPRPREPQETMALGLAEFQTPRSSGFFSLLLNPFRDR